MSEAFDLDQFAGLQKAQEDGIDVEILGPDGKKLGKDGFAIRVAGPDSKRFLDAVAEVQKQRQEAEDDQPLSPASIAASRVGILARCVISWTPVKLGGEALPYSVENAEKLFTRFPFIREQVERKQGNRAAFLPASPRRSKELAGEQAKAGAA